MLETAPTFRLATLNLLHNRESLEERVDLVIEELKAIQPDALCLQEVLELPDFNILKRINSALGWKGGYRGRVKVSADESHGNAILAKQPLTKIHDLDSNPQANEVENIAASLIHGGKLIHLLSVHFPWGSQKEFIRAQHAYQISDHVQLLHQVNPESLSLLAGDFNSGEESDTLRFMNGLSFYQEKSTFWTDAWDVAGQENNWATTRIDTEFAISTAKSVGIRYPHLMPTRRIDYIKSFGWNYGQPGHPTKMERWADSEGHNGLTISDHYGLYADFLL